MGLLQTALAPLRAILGGAEHEAEEALPVRDIREIQTEVLGTAESIKSATESIEAHVLAFESLATSIEPLTAAVVDLTRQLSEINQALAPVTGLERDVSMIERAFGRHRQHDPAAPEEPAQS
jgi:chromosome segregation ATPase